jgi:hypothetical protein
VGRHGNPTDAVLLRERKDGLRWPSHFHDHVDLHSVPFGAGRNGAQTEASAPLKVPLLIQAYFLKANCDYFLNRRNNLKECYFGVGQL